MIMKYYKLVYDYENDEHYINCDEPHIGDMDEYCVSNGKKIDNWQDVSFGYNSREGNIVSDYVANLFRWFLVTNYFVDSVADIFNEQNVQLLPVTLIDKSGCKENITCQVVNILDVIDDALDLDNSKYDFFELDDERILSVEKYALKKENIKNHDLFRIKDDTIPIFVSEKIKKIIVEKEMKGFVFIEIEVN